MPDGARCNVVSRGRGWLGCCDELAAAAGSFWLAMARATETDAAWLGSSPFHLMLFLYVQLLMYREMFYICSDYAPLRTFAKLDLFLRS